MTAVGEVVIESFKMVLPRRISSQVVFMLFCCCFLKFHCFLVLFGSF